MALQSDSPLGAMSSSCFDRVAIVEFGNAANPKSKAVSYSLHVSETLQLQQLSFLSICCLRRSVPIAKMRPLPNLVLIHALTLLDCVDAFWRMNCAPIQVGRIDPLVDPGAVAAHTHLIDGGSSKTNSAEEYHVD